MTITTWGWRAGAAAVCAATLGVAGSRLMAQDATPQAAPIIPITLSTKAPAGAVVLYGGKQDQLAANWYKRYSKDAPNWTVDAEGTATPQKADITSQQEFGDAYVHVEFREPMEGHGNAGVGLQGRYEVQIMNSYGAQPEKTGCGAFYNQLAPRVVASKKAGEWQTMDIIFRAPRFDANNQVTSKARATVFQNGILIQNNEEFSGPTGIQYGELKGESPTGPIILQGDHDQVQYRNVWVVKM